MLNVLFIAAGRRVTLATLFQRHNCKVFNYDLAKEVPISDVATTIIGKKWDDPTLEEDLINVIKQYKIDVALCLDCKGVEVISQIAATLETCSENLSVVCPNVKPASICLDKSKLAKFMEKYFPAWYPSPIIDQPFVIKPKSGCGSHGIEFGAMCSKEILKSAETENVVQLRLTGQEYSVDAYFNKQGKMVGASPRTRIWVSGGEVLESETVNNAELISMTKQIGEKIKLTGPTCFQYIKDSADNPKLMEINARFGGGATLSVEAGLDMIELIIEEYVHGIKLKEDSVHAEHGVYVNRSFRDHYFRMKQ